MHRYLTRFGIALAVALAVAAALAPLASAASTETTPVVAGDLDVQLWPGAMPGQGVAILALTLPEKTALPARVRIPVPAGSSVDWAGEIGADTSADVERPRTIQQGPNGAYAEFDVIASRAAQLEVSGLPLAVDNGVYSVKLDYVQAAPAKVTGFSVRLPAGATDVSISPAPPGAPETNAAGESLYTLTSAELKDGESRTVTASYRLGAAAGGAQASGGGTSVNLVLGVLAGALVLVAIVLVIVLRRESPDA